MMQLTTDLWRLAFLLNTDALLKSETVESLEARPRYRVSWMGSKQKLLDWIWKHTPDGVESVADAFSGSSAVAYMYKLRGLRVLANDLLAYPHHVARAIVENGTTTLPEADAACLLASRRPKTILQDHYAGKFYQDDGILKSMDVIRSNAENLSGYRRDIALAALARTAITARGHFGHFRSGTPSDSYTAEQFEAAFLKNVESLNSLVFEGADGCKAYHKDVGDFLDGIKVDLVYFDPPYATDFDSTNYLRTYRFIEHVMSHEAEAPAVGEDTGRKNAGLLFDRFTSRATHIPTWLISYRDKATPDQKAIKAMVSTHGRRVSVKSREHAYQIQQGQSGANLATENLYVCIQEPAATKPNTQGEIMKPLMHTSIPIEISCSAEAMPTPDTGSEPTFWFSLCHEGTNRNGDHFLAEELRDRAQTAINKKIDLQHDKKITDIVGAILTADYVEGADGGRIECVGELFVTASQSALLAYRLMKRGIVSQVSMECDYEEGECSICGKRAKTKADYCAHLKRYKGGEYNGKPVYEVLHGVTFTGVGLLDRKGADENAKITQVASKENCIEGAETDNGPNTGEKETGMELEELKSANKTLTERIAELEAENQSLKAKVAELEKKIEANEAEKAASAKAARAQALVSKVSEAGLLKTDEDRAAEAARLADLDDAAFAATEAAYDRAIAAAKSSDDAKAKAALEAKANRRPTDVPDDKGSIYDELGGVFKKAMEERLGR